MHLVPIFTSLILATVFTTGTANFTDHVPEDPFPTSILYTTPTIEPEEGSNFFDLEPTVQSPKEILETHIKYEAKSSPSIFADEENVVKTSDLTDELETWEAPLYLQKAFPYYHSGYDDEGRPVWVAEGGKYPTQYLRLLQQMDNSDLEKDIDKYLAQVAYRIEKSIKDPKASNEDAADAFFIMDCDGLSVSEIAHPKVLLVIVKIFRAYRELIIKQLGACVVINMNYVGEIILSLLRPVLGRALEKVEFFGTNPTKWKAAFRQRLPLKAIPPWYGGSDNFKPIQIYG